MRRASAHGNMLADDIREVMEVDEDLVHPGLGERVQPDVEHGLACDRYHALRGGVGDRPEATANPGREEECLHPAAFRTTPRSRIRAFAAASTPSRPSMPLSQSA